MAQITVTASSVPTLDGLFFALRPPPAVARQICDAAAIECLRYGIEDGRTSETTLHVSLFGLVAFEGIPPGLIERARQSAALMKAYAFDWRLDLLSGFNRSRWGDKYALVMRSAVVCDELVAFRAELGRAMGWARAVRRAPRSITPHVTVAYTVQRFSEAPLSALNWHVDEFVLIHSLIGKSEHRVLGSWSLHPVSDAAALGKAAAIRADRAVQLQLI